MPTFKRVQMEGSEELFRPTLAEVSRAQARPEPEPSRDPDAISLVVSREELELLIDAVQLARYPDKARPVQPLHTFDRLAELRLRLEAARQQ